MQRAYSELEINKIILNNHVCVCWWMPVHLHACILSWMGADNEVSDEATGRYLVSLPCALEHRHTALDIE